MTLNKIPVLDKGFISLFSTSMDEKYVREAKRILYRNRQTGEFGHKIRVHVLIKSPVFVQLSLGGSGISYDNAQAGIPEAYVPTVNDVRAKDLETSEIIAKDIEQTTEALLLNPKSYQMDACDVFVSQVITPISVYNTYLASANLSAWIEYINRKDLPGPIDQYREAIENVLRAEWPSLSELFDAKTTKGKGKAVADRKKNR